MHHLHLLAPAIILALVGATALAAPAMPAGEPEPALDAPSLQWVASAATWTCDDVIVDPLGTASYDADCPTGGAIRPGVRANGCTLSWIVSDGTDLYITTAGHCGSVGRSFSVSGVGTIGSVVFREFNGDLLNMRDWAFIKIDPAVHAAVDPTMVHFGGPLGAAALVDPHGPVRPPLPGDGVLQYGHGRGLGQEDATKARAGVVATTLPTALVYPGTVGPGDSGSPVRAASGEALGIAVAGGVVQMGDNTHYVPDRCAEVEAVVPGACDAYWDACTRLDGACHGVWRQDGLYGIVYATRMDAALEAFEAWLGQPAWVVAGELPGVDVVR